MHRAFRSQCLYLRMQVWCIGYVDGDESMLLAVDAARQSSRDLLQLVGAARQHGDAGAEQGEFLRGGAAYADRGAADQCMFAGEVQVHVNLR